MFDIVETYIYKLIIFLIVIVAIVIYDIQGPVPPTISPRAGFGACELILVDDVVISSAVIAFPIMKPKMKSNV